MGKDTLTCLGTAFHLADLGFGFLYLLAELLRHCSVARFACFDKGGAQRLYFFLEALQLLLRIFAVDLKPNGGGVVICHNIFFLIG